MHFHSAQGQDTHISACHSTLYGSEGGFLSSNIDSKLSVDTLCGSQAHRPRHVITLLFESTPSTCIQQSVCRERERCIATCYGKRHEVGNRAVIDDIPRRLLNLRRELTPVAHYEPQKLWSQICPNTDARCGQAVRTPKDWEALRSTVGHWPSGPLLWPDQPRFQYTQLHRSQTPNSSSSVLVPQADEPGSTRPATAHRGRHLAGRRMNPTK